jgi:DNA segregation ATPase FtsK/SpoIIIE, S-DNA-T family
MKIKFTLQRQAGSVDLIATVDSATTVGSLASYLATADPAARQVMPAEDLTLGLLGSTQLAIDPAQLVADSGLRSGATITLSRGGGMFADPHRAAAAVVHVLAGPDAGREYEVPAGSSVIGRERGCEVRLTDALVSRRHARINVGDVVEIIDLGSANGMLIDGVAMPRSILRSADTVELGDSRISVRMLHRVGVGKQAQRTATGFVRPPRLDPVGPQRTFEAPALPERQTSQRLPLIPLLAPLLVGALLYLITRSLTAIVFVTLSPIMILGNLIESRLSGRATYKQALKEFWADVDSLVADATEAVTAEAGERRREHPSTTECVEAARTTAPLLWTRRPCERGFGEVRLGLARLPSRTVIELPSAGRATRALSKELSRRVAPFATIEGVPVVAALTDSALGIAGPHPLSAPVARALVMQLAALHSPAELILSAAVSTGSATDWEWLKWLPHTTSASSPLSERHLAASPSSGAALVSSLEELLGQRLQADDSAGPAVVLVVENDVPVERSRLVSLAEQGPARAIFLIWIAADISQLPAACANYVEVHADGVTGAAGFVRAGSVAAPLALELCPADAATETARLLAPLVDIGARADDASDLPRSVSLLAVNNPELAYAPEAVLERWTENRSILTGPRAPATPPRHSGSLRAVIGQSANQVHALDLRRDGPHALVGGTTGSGKSELLQSWILALATAHSPQRLTFLLVDYKGGSAFSDCVDLPHTVGLVTDLSPRLVRRALSSLSAELRHREHLLASHAAKDLMTMERLGVVDAPPSLVIVVDEFAALVKEVPEFVDGVVNVAQRGRSLGLHLILATQRPAGVIKDNLRANTNLRLALRMADEADSTDVLGSAEAAYFSSALPGRAVSKTGPGRLVPFQTGYVGGWSSDAPPPPDIIVEELGFGARGSWQPPEPTDVAAVDPGPTDIRRVVATVATANAIAHLPKPRKPWLPELRQVYDLADREAVPTRRTDAELVFGVRDDPDRQSQPTVAFYPDREGNLAVYGTGGSGKSTLLRTIAIAAGFTIHSGPSHIYGLDFGARGLAMLEDLPHVGSIITGSDHARITRLLASLRGIVDERALRYSQADAATITEYRQQAGRPDEPRVLLLVDGIAAFRQAYDMAGRARWLDMFTSIATDGRPVGVHVIVSADQRAGLYPALAAAVQSRVVLRLPTADDYSTLGVSTDVLTAASPPGRGLVGDAELQVAVLGGVPDSLGQAAAVRAFAEAMRKAGASSAPPIGRLSESVPLSELPSSVDGQPVLGIASQTLAPFGIEPRGSFLISGPPSSGRTTAMRALAMSLQRWDPDVELYYFGTRRSPLVTGVRWRETAFGDDAGVAAADLTSRIAQRSLDDPPVAVFIENPADFLNGPADPALQSLCKSCLAEDQFLVVEGETSTLTGSYGLLGLVKSGRTGLALQPDQGDGIAMYRTDFPRIDRGEYPPGRALLVKYGRTEVVQVASTPD